MTTAVMNGWRRLGVVLIALWVLSATGIVAYEFTAYERQDATVNTSHSTLKPVTDPDLIKRLNAQADSQMTEEQALAILNGTPTSAPRQTDGQNLFDQFDPPTTHSGIFVDWRSWWKPIKERPTELKQATDFVFKAKRFLIVVAVLPIVLWVMLEVACGAAVWVKRGFQSDKRA